MKRLFNCLSVFFVLLFFVSCQKEMSVEQAAPAKGSLQSDFGDCLPKKVSGTYVAARTLIDSNFIEVTVNVAATGSYVIATDTVNGYSFKAIGVFNSTGAITVKLQGNGQPVASGVNSFAVSFDTSVCFISIPVAPAASSGGPATFTLQTSGSGGCASFTPAGSYVKDVTLISSNTVSVGVNVTATGTYSITTNTVNGYSFSGSGSFSATGAQTVILTGTGKPVAAGTDNFTTTAGASNCPFAITVVSTAPPVVVNTDYFPTTLNSYWTYNYTPPPADTFKITNNGPVALNGTTFQRFIYSDANGPFDTSYYRKDATTNFYYESIDTAGSGPSFTFSQPRLEILFLKNTLTTNQTWNTDINANYMGTPVTVRIKYTCLDAAATVTVNGKTFTNAYKVQENIQIGQAGLFADLPNAPPIIQYYVKGVGLVQINDGTDTQDIRFWQVF